MKRRHFFKSLAGVTGTLLISANKGYTNGDHSNPIIQGNPSNPDYWKNLRKQFLIPENYTYLNTGGLGSSPRCVSDCVKKMMDKENMYPSAGHDEKDWWRIKEKLTVFLGDGVEKEEIALVSTATEGINIILNGLDLKEGDEVITSNHEHVALQIPLIDKLQRRKIVIKSFEPDLIHGLGNVKQIESLITSRTRLIFTSHVTCTTGQIMPLKEIGELASSRDILFGIDGAQAIGQVPVDVKDMKVDFYTASGHKWLLGPKRTGILYLKKSLLDQVKPSIVGAYSNGCLDFDKRTMDFHATAQRYEYGTQNDALILGLETAVDFVKEIGLKNIYTHNDEVTEFFYQGLKELAKKKKLAILSPEEEEFRSSIISFRFPDKDNAKYSKCLDKDHFRVRIVNEANLDAIRVSFHVYNVKEEAERLLNRLSKK